MHKFGGNTVYPIKPILLFLWLSRVVCDISKKKALIVRVFPGEPKGLGESLVSMRLKGFEVCI